MNARTKFDPNLLRPRDARWSLASGTGIAATASVSSDHITLDVVNAAGGRRALDLLVLDQLRIEAWDRLLFLECGDGWIAEEAWRRARRAYACGLDASAAHVELARRLREVPGRLEFKTWDGWRLPLPDRGFDCVVATFALARSDDPAGLLHEMHRVMRPGGEVYVLNAVSSDAEFRLAMAQTGFAEVRELARFDGQAAVLVHAGTGRPAPSASPPAVVDARGTP